MELRPGEGVAHEPSWTLTDGLPAHEPAADRDFVASLARGLAVIQAFANHQQRLSIAKISQKTGIARAAVRRYLHTLAALGYVVTHDGSRFSLLPKVVSLGQAYLSAPSAAQAHLDALAAEVGESCSLGVLDGVDLVYLARANSSSVMSPRFTVGARLPAHCTSIGRVLLAELPESQLAERLAAMKFLPYTARTVASPAALRECLTGVQRDGFAVADQQLEPGFRSIAVAVRGRTGEVVAGINVIVHIARAGVAQMSARFLAPLAATASLLGSSLDK